MRKLIWLLVAAVALLAIVNAQVVSPSYFLNGAEMVASVVIVLVAVLIGVIVAIMILLRNQDADSGEDREEG